MRIGLKPALRTRRVLLACGGAVAVLVTGVGVWAATGPPPAATEPAGTATVDRGPVTLDVAAAGSVQPAQTRTLSFAVAGTVTEVNVRVGDVVKAGQMLAEIDDDDARSRVTEAEQELDDAQTALAEAGEAAGQSTPECQGGTIGVVLRHPTGSTPTPAQPTGSAGPTDPPVQPTSPAPEPTRTPPNPAPTDGSTPGRPPDPSPGAPGGADGGTDSECAGRDGGGTSQLAAEQRVNSAQRQLAEAEDQLAGTRISAPTEGKVLSIGGAVGSAVSAGSTFVQLADVNSMQVTTSFPEADAGRLALGLPAEITFPDRPGETFAATVVQVDPVGSADGSVVTFGAMISFTDMPPDLLIGQSAGVQVTTAEVTDAIRVPVTALGSIADGAGSIRVRTDGGPEERRVTIGLRGDQHVEVTSGLAAGETVFTTW